VYYHFATLLAFVAPISSRLSQLRSLTPVCLGPPENCKLPSQSRDVIVRESSELKKEIRKYVSLASIELKLSWPLCCVISQGKAVALDRRGRK